MYLKINKQIIMRFSIILTLCYITIGMVTAEELMSQVKKETDIELLLIDASAVSVIEAISQETGYDFFFDEDNLSKIGQITVKAKSATIQQVLQQVTEQTGLVFQKMDDTFVVIPPAEPLKSNKSENNVQPGITITGTVTGTDGESMPGVVVMIKGSQQGTVTSVDGKYSINVPDANATLVFSFVGYATQEIIVGSQRTIDVTLNEDARLIDEVVVVGYGTQKKATLTGSVATTKGEDLQKVPTTNLVSSLTGRMTGVVINTRDSDPGRENIQVNIRGKSSWQSGNNVLVIIDGIANREGWERINPDEVESISVLKDASAAIYGSRAANGVILITTKRGNTGRPILDYHGNVSLTQLTRVPELTNSWQFATYYTEAQTFAGHVYTQEQIQAFKDGDLYSKQYPNYDIWDLTLSNASPQTTHTVSIRGGNDAVKYFVSGRYLFQEAVWKNTADNMKNYSIRSNIDAKVTKNLSMSLNLLGRREDRQWSAESVKPTQDVQDSSFFGFILSSLPVNPLSLVNDPSETPWVYKHYRNYQIEGARGIVNNDKAVINSQFTLRWDLPFITEGLFLEGTGAYDFTNERTKNYSHAYDFWDYDAASDTYINSNRQPMENRSLSDRYQNTYQYTLTGRLGYNKVIAGIHNINAFIAYEQYSTNMGWITASRSLFLSDDIPFLFAGSADTQRNDGSGTEFAYRNMFGRIAYAYNDRYMLDFTLRRDESLRFSPEVRTGYFPGISAGWRLSEENFIKDRLTFVDYLKLRASWGQMGSDNVDAFQYLATAALRSSDDSYVFGVDTRAYSTLYLGNTPNPNMKWEVASTTNLGLDGDLWNGLLGFEVDYFFTKRTEILARRSASIPVYTGLSLPNENLGEAQNQGIELLLKTRKQMRDFFYNISANITYTSNKIIYMDESPNIPDYQKQEGHPIESFLLYKTDGIFRTQEEVDNTVAKYAGTKPGDVHYVDVDGNGVIDANDRVRLYESPTPKFIFGLNFDFSYKGFDLTMLWQGQSGAKTRINPFNREGDINVPMWIYKDRWTPETAQTATMPRAFYHRAETLNRQDSDFWLRDASFLRLKSLELGYNIPSKITSVVSISNAKVYISGFNLLCIDKIKNYDPEIVNYMGTFYPSTKVFNVGLHLTF